jgi:hypothetical protein
MIVPVWYSAVAFLAAAMAGGLACLLYFRRKASSSYPHLSALFGAIAIAQAARGLGVLDSPNGLFWQRIALASELLGPAFLLRVGVAFYAPAQKEKDVVLVWGLRIISVFGLLLAFLALTDRVLDRQLLNQGVSGIGLVSSWGYLPYVFLVITMTVGLAQLEMVLRASQEPVRYRLKFIVIGLGGWQGIRFIRLGRCYCSRFGSRNISSSPAQPQLSRCR